MVSQPITQEVVDYATYTARVAAVESVELRAHVWGYLDKVAFKEGSLVKKGDVLFELDPRPYQAQLDQARAEVERLNAQLQLDDVELRRATELLRRQAGTREDYDRASAQVSQSRAALAAAEAKVEQAELDLGYTKVTAPVSGRTSRYNVTVGNFIQAGNQGTGTLLTTIVSVDPIYAYFDVDEQTVLRVRKFIREGRMRSARETEIPVSLGLSTEEGFPHQGTINFVDNQVNPRTGTLRVRGVFSNKDEVLAPGYFCRVRVPVGPAHRVLLVSDRALANDQGRKVLYVVDDKNKVVMRPVQTGALHDGLRAIEDGLGVNEKVVVNGLLQIRPGLTVNPEIVTMPRSANGASAGTHATPVAETAAH
jgi:RND family efflux transporter MFP subunit